MADGNQSYDDYNIYDDEESSPGFLARLRGFFSGLGERINWKVVLVILGVAVVSIIALVLLFAFLKRNSGMTPEPPKVSAIEVEQSLVLPRTDNTALGVVHFVNPNSDYGLPNLAFSWKAYDGQGSELKSGFGNTYILPGLDKYVLIPFVDIKPLSLKVEVEALPEDFAMLPNSKSIALDRVNLANANETGGFYMTGGFLNKSPYIIRSLDVLALVRDSAGRLIAAAATEASDIEPGVIKPFELFWPKALPESAIVDIRTSFNLYNDFNFPLPVTDELEVR